MDGRLQISGKKTIKKKKPKRQNKKKILNFKIYFF